MATSADISTDSSTTHGASLADFLPARIAEDEVAAYAAADAPRFPAVIPSSSPKLTEAYIHHVARVDPARVLAECEAKRLIVGNHVDNGGLCLWCEHPSPCTDLRLLALPYADHPDFRPEWRPSEGSDQR